MSVATTSAAKTALIAIADEAFTAIDSGGRQVQPFSARHPDLTLDDAYRVTSLLRAAFEARGEKILGRKIGFTNRTIWAQYGVYAPIWGYVTDATVYGLSAPSPLRGEDRGEGEQDSRSSRTVTPSPGSRSLSSGHASRGPVGDPTSPQMGRGEESERVLAATARVADFAEPRIEPEIMFGLKAAPAPDMDEAALLDCIDWVALGYEVVQSLFPGWKFQPADTVAANGLHGALHIGPRHTIAPRKADWLRELAMFTCELSCDGKFIDSGGGASVLDSPLSALRHLVGMLAKDAHNPPLAAGEIISTGTLTKAMPVAAGETWTTKVTGIPLEAISLRFE